MQVMLSSISASAKGVANHSIYSGSKGAVEAFARCLAVGESLSPALNGCVSFLNVSADFGSKGITVNAIAPGGIKTDMYVEAARKYIPNEASMTDEQIDEVSASLCISLQYGADDTCGLACGRLVPSQACRDA